MILEDITFSDGERTLVDTKKDTDLRKMIEYANSIGYLTGKITQIMGRGDNSAIFLYNNLLSKDKSLPEARIISVEKEKIITYYIEYPSLVHIKE